MIYVCDNYRHLVCLPYSRENLYKMARELGIPKHWFEVSKLGHAHFDIPKRRLDQIKSQCVVVSPKDIVRIIKGDMVELVDTGDLKSPPQ